MGCAPTNNIDAQPLKYILFSETVFLLISRIEEHRLDRNHFVIFFL